MANEKNLKNGKPFQIKSGEEAATKGRKGGKASGKVRREKADLRKMAQAVLDGTYTTRDGEAMTGADLVWKGIMENIGSPEGRNWGKAMEMLAMLSGANMSPEQRASIKAATAKTKAETKALRDQTEQHNVNIGTYAGIPATLIAPAFQPVLLDIAEGGHTEYDFPGGRGSTKSSFVALEIVDLIMKSEDKARANYYAYHTGRKWGEHVNFNLSLDSGYLSLEDAVDLIIAYTEKQIWRESTLDDEEY